MKLKLVLYIAILLVFAASCKDEWDNHYSEYPEAVDQNVWEAIADNPELSEFVKIIEDLEYDTLFNSDMPYTLLVPTNEAINLYEEEMEESLIKYHILKHLILSVNIQGRRLVETLSDKFAFFERNGAGLKIDGIPVQEESPLYKNGKYFIIDQVAESKPNLYEYFVLNNPVLRAYIDSQDSIILDREASEPIGFNDEGETVYDSVSVVFNKFEDEFFPVKQEFRNQAATIVFPLKEDYENALTVMAQDLNVEGFNDYNDIPREWQQEFLIPYLLEQGVFANRLEPQVYMKEPGKDSLRLKNILGDSIDVYYSVADKFVCSNGYAYNYVDFVIPDSLFTGALKYEGEMLLQQTGVNRYAWAEDVIVTSDNIFIPGQYYDGRASNDSIMIVEFPRGYNGEFSVEFNSNPLFPRKYLMVVRTNMDVGGVYDIYVNDQLVREGFDYSEYYNSTIFGTGFLPKITLENEFDPTQYYRPEGRFNKFDMKVENIDAYGKAKIRFEYKGPGTDVTSNGLVIDYIEFIPWEDTWN